MIWKCFTYVKVILTSVKRVRQTLFKTVMIGLETAAVGFCRRGERLSWSPDTTKGSRDSQLSGRVRKGSVDGKWQERLVILAKLTEQDSCCRQARALLSGMVRNEGFGQISRVIRYPNKSYQISGYPIKRYQISRVGDTSRIPAKTGLCGIYQDGRWKSRPWSLDDKLPESQVRESHCHLLGEEALSLDTEVVLAGSEHWGWFCM